MLGSIFRLYHYVFTNQRNNQMKLKLWHLAVILALCFVAIRAYDFWLYGQEIK
jgi:hypothetical protein